MTAANLTFDSGTLTLNGNDLTVSNLMTVNANLDVSTSTVSVPTALTVNNSTLTVAAAGITTQTLTLDNGVIAGGAVTPTVKLSLNNLASHGDISGTGFDVYIGETHLTDDAKVKLTGTNTYDGTTVIRRGSLEVDADAANLASGKLIFQAVNWNLASLLQTSGTFARTINAADGVYWQEHGGFAATDVPLTVTLTRGDAQALPLKWTDASNGFNGKTLHMNSPTSTAAVELTNDIEIDNYNSCQVYVYDNPASNDDMAILSGNITSNGDFRLRHFGDGTLVLTGTNDFGVAGELEIQGNGAVRTQDGSSLPSTAKLYLNGGVLESNGTFSREIGNAAGKVFWNNTGGFAAQGGALTVTLTPAGGAFNDQLTWGNGTTGFNGKNLSLGSVTADNAVTLTNPIDAGNSNRDIYLYDNASSTADRAVLAGDVTGLKRLRLYRGGTLVIGAAATMSLNGGDGGADVELHDGSTLIVNGRLNLADDLVCSSGGETLGGSGTIDTHSIAGNTTIVNINNGRKLSPGDGGTGTLTIDTASGDELQMDGGSTYLWDVGQPGSTDVVRIIGAGRLDINNMTLNISDDSGYVASETDQLPVFLYDAGTTVVETLGTIAFNIDNLDGTWTVGTGGLSLVDDGNGLIYLTGLSGGTIASLPGDVNNDGFVDAADYIIIKQNFGTLSGALRTEGDLTGEGAVNIDDILALKSAMAAAGGAVTPEPATLFVMMAAGLPALLKRRRSRS